MRNTVLIFCAVFATLGLSTFGVMNLNSSTTDQLETTVKTDVVMNTVTVKKVNKKIFTDFIYDVGPRFGPMKKNKLEKATSIDAFFSAEELQKMVSLKSLSIIVIIDDKRSDIRETGTTATLTEGQLKLIQSFDYATNFLVRAEYQKINKETGALEDSYSTPHQTIVPEKQAEYASGEAALIKYLQENSKEAIANVEADKLQPAKLFFTVTKKGGIENVRLDRPSGYPEVDKTMIELISNAPGKWQPGENVKGEKVSQELVVSFGLMGC